MFRCAPVVAPPEPDRIPPADCRVIFFPTIEAAGVDWDAAAPPDNVFLQRPFLSALAQCPPAELRFGYLVFYRGQQPAGVAALQCVTFIGRERLNQSAPPNANLWTRMGQKMKQVVSNQIQFDTLLCGNLLATGEHGWWFDERYLHLEDGLVLLEEGLAIARRTMSSGGALPAVTMVKDTAPQRMAARKFLSNKRFAEFEIQPNMRMALPYSSFEEYLGEMSTKYRTRAKRAFKKLGNITKVELSLADLQRERDTMYQLYRSVLEGADFNLITLNPYYFINLKRTLGDQFRLFGYYQEGVLVSFYSMLHNYLHVEAHFLGYDKSKNHEHQLYLNMLYDMVGYGIKHHFTEVIFARTALEIKSSVGAEPEALYCHLLHHNPLVNPIAGCMLEYVKPVEQWVQRRPFKQQVEVEEGVKQEIAS